MANHFFEWKISTNGQIPLKNYDTLIYEFSQNIDIPLIYNRFLFSPINFRRKINERKKNNQKHLPKMGAGLISS